MSVINRFPKPIEILDAAPGDVVVLAERTGAADVGLVVKAENEQKYVAVLSSTDANVVRSLSQLIHYNGHAYKITDDLEILPLEQWIIPSFAGRMQHFALVVSPDGKFGINVVPERHNSPGGVAWFTGEKMSSAPDGSFYFPAWKIVRPERPGEAQWVIATLEETQS